MNIEGLKGPRAQGLKGFRGFTGFEGFNGFTGFKGFNGLRAQGCHVWGGASAFAQGYGGPPKPRRRRSALRFHIWPTLSALLVVTLLLASPLLAAQAPARKPAPRPAVATAAADPRLAQAEAALAAGDVDKAFALATAAAGARSAGSKAHVLLARVQLAQGALEPAWQSLDRAIASDPRNIDALAYMGLVAGKLAAGAFERLQADAPESARVKQLEGETYELQQRADDAEKAYGEALAVNPTLLDVLLSLARLKRGRLGCEDAVALYERAEAVRPTFDAAYGLGFCRAYLQEDEAAVAAYERAVQRDPAAAVAWSGLGSARVKLGRTAAGIEALERAVSLEPKMSDGWYMLGMAYQSAGNAERSKAAFAKAAELRVGGKQ